MTSLTDKIMRLAARLMPDADGEWSAAMQGELAHLEDGKSLNFALGCLRAAGKRKLKTEHYEPLGRGFIALCFAIWATVKLYFSGMLARANLYPGRFKASAWDKIDLSTGQTVLIGSALIFYALATYALFTRKWLWLALSLMGALALNTAHISIIMRNGYYGNWENSRLLFSYAATSEEYFILSLSFIGCVALYWWPRVMAGHKPWRAL